MLRSPSSSATPPPRRLVALLGIRPGIISLNTSRPLVGESSIVVGLSFWGFPRDLIVDVGVPVLDAAAKLLDHAYVGRHEESVAQDRIGDQLAHGRRVEQLELLAGDAQRRPGAECRYGSGNVGQHRSRAQQGDANVLGPQ